MFLLVLFALVVFIQLFYYHFLFGKFIYHKPSGNRTQTDAVPVSVVICARNEARNLQENIPLIAGQDYPDFELVLVNDGSTDDTLAVMKKLKKKLEANSSVRQIQIIDLTKKNGRGGKKQALSAGIAEAANPNLVLTDADCKPLSKNWLRLMTSGLNGEKEIVLGYGAYEVKENAFLNKLIRFETVFTALQYFSYALAGMPYMGVGRNLAYTKKIFNSSKGFKLHEDLLSGDDDLFIQDAASSENTAICTAKDAFTVSKPQDSFFNWFNQKRRHVTTSGRYQFRHRLLLGIFYLTQLLFWVLAIVLLVKGVYVELTILFITVRFMVWFNTVNRTLKKLEEPGLLILAPFLEISLVLSQLFIFIVNLITPPKRW